MNPQIVIIRLLTASALLFLNGCTTWFFQPSKVDYTAGWEKRDSYLKTNDFFTSESGNMLNYWVFPSKKNIPPKAIVLQFHGNAQNISSHFASLGWTADFGYEFLTFDYSGYGKSSGKANIKSALLDIKSALKFAASRAKEKNIPLVLYAQSFGGALLLKSLRSNSQEVKPCAIFVESSFYSMPKIAQSVANRVWLLWPIQWIPLLTISSKYNPTGKGLENFDDIPKYVIHAKEDPVVPYRHGKKLYEKLSGKKDFWEYENGHISFWLKPDQQKKLISTLDLRTKDCRIQN